MKSKALIDFRFLDGGDTLAMAITTPAIEELFPGVINPARNPEVTEQLVRQAIVGFFVGAHVNLDYKEMFPPISSEVWFFSFDNWRGKNEALRLVCEMVMAEILRRSFNYSIIEYKGQMSEIVFTMEIANGRR